MGVVGSSYAGDTVALFTLDAGITSGYTEGVYELDIRKYENSFDVVANGLWHVGQIKGSSELESAAAISRRFLKFMADCNLDGIGVDRIKFVYEDFILYPDKKHYAGRAGISSARVVAHAQGMLYTYKGIRYVPQMASGAKVKATTERLQRNGLWIPNKPHGMDAVRHAVVWVAGNLS